MYMWWKRVDTTLAPQYYEIHNTITTELYTSLSHC